MAGRRSRTCACSTTSPACEASTRAWAESRAVAGLRLISPRPGAPAEYAVLESSDGARFALTPTCAANALGEVPRGAYSAGREDSARMAYTIAASALGCESRE